MKRYWVWILMICLVTSGCARVEKMMGSFFSSKKEKFAEELAEDGMKAYQAGNYHKAIEDFSKLKDWYPFSKFAILAELKIADSHYHLKQYEEAILAYEEFENLHPRNEATPYVVYQLGRCYFDQITTSDRDQTPVHNSLEIFQRLLRQFPGNEYGSRAQVHINHCLKLLAQSEYMVGIHYYKNKHYRGALERFKSVITSYPDIGIHNQALTYIAKCEASMAESVVEE